MILEYLGQTLIGLCGDWGPEETFMGVTLAGVTLALLVCFTFSVLFPHFHTGCPRGPSVKTYLHLHPPLEVASGNLS